MSEVGTMAFWKRSTDAPATQGAWSPLTDEHKTRRKHLALLWDYYGGSHRPGLVVKPGQADDNVILNDCRRVVDQSVWFLFGQEVGFEIDETTEERTAEEQYIDALWGRGEQKQSTLTSLAINGSVTGLAAMRLYAPEPGVADALPRVQVLDPMTLDIVTDPNDIEMVYAYAVVWFDGVANRWRRHHISLQESGTWLIEPQIATNGSTWQTAGDVEAWPYPFAPIVICQNLPNPNALWGVSDLADADLNDRINFTASNLNRILRFHAHPKTIGTGFAASSLQNTAVDQFWTIPGADAKVYNLEMQSDLASSVEFLRILRQTFYRLTQTADIDPREVAIGQMSGFALRLLYNEPLTKMAAKRNLYGAMLVDVCERALVLGGYAPQAVKCVWRDPLPVSGTEQVQALVADRNNGLSQATYLELRGYSPEREAQRRAEETAQSSNVGAALLAAFERGGPA